MNTFDLNLPEENETVNMTSIIKDLEKLIEDINYGDASRNSIVSTLENLKGELEELEY